eukprot:752800-Hanusia_phi.AAC.1
MSRIRKRPSAKIAAQCLEQVLCFGFLSSSLLFFLTAHDAYTLIRVVPNSLLLATILPYCSLVLSSWSPTFLALIRSCLGARESGMGG